MHTSAAPCAAPATLCCACCLACCKFFERHEALLATLRQLLVPDRLAAMGQQLLELAQPQLQDWQRAGKVRLRLQPTGSIRSAIDDHTRADMAASPTARAARWSCGAAANAWCLCLPGRWAVCSTAPSLSLLQRQLLDDTPAGLLIRRCCLAVHSFSASAQTGCWRRSWILKAALRRARAAHGRCYLCCCLDASSCARGANAAPECYSDSTRWFCACTGGGVAGAAPAAATLPARARLAAGLAGGVTGSRRL